MTCIINAAWGAGYVKGQNRLVQSLRDHGYEGQILTWANKQINDLHDIKYPYTMKSAAFAEAASQGYTNIIWLDCSIICIRDPSDFLNLVETEGMYFWKSGWNLAQSATDSDLEIGGFTRDQAEKLHECASGIVGLNINRPESKELLRKFTDYCQRGVCKTSRLHDNQSKDPRFKFGRQDQTAFTMAYYNTKFNTPVKMHEPGVYSSYSNDRATYDNTVTFLVHGI